MIKQVTFRYPFTLPTLGMELPAGTYALEVEHIPVPLHGYDVGFDVETFYVDKGVLGENDLGFASKLSKGELQKALAEDRAKP